MKIYLFISLCLLLGGCAHALNVDIKGHNLETPYGKIEDGEIHIHTIWGNKSQAIVTPTPINDGASATTSIPVTVSVTPGKGS